jgi:hypothetical protein
VEGAFIMMISMAELTVLILLVTGTIGAIRGWGREVITTAIVLGTLLFLELGGGILMSNLFLGSAAGGGSAGTAACFSTSGSLSPLIFGGMTMLGYYAGNRHGMKPVEANHRIAGVVPGLVNGGAISYYLSQHVIGARGLLNALNGLAFLAALPVLLGLGLISLLVALFVSHHGSKAAKAH